jgi:RNA polymerase sigma factor (sigma-70 family)
MKLSALTEFLHGLRLRMAHSALAGDSDPQLLDRFHCQGDDTAFAVLVQRHGPMVLGVCRRTLGHEHEAEDAFQATFLVLVRKAGGIRKRDSLAGWLHGVAHRIATKVQSKSMRRRELEEKAARDVEQPAMDSANWDELRKVLDEEIQRLPNRLRVPFILCHLQQKTHAQAAAELRLERSSVSVRLRQASELLCKRLTKRGVQLSVTALVGLLAEKAASAALPAGLLVSTVKLATLWAAGKTALASAGSAGAITLAKEALKGMLAMKVKLVLASLSVGLAVAGAGVAGYQRLGSAPSVGTENTQESRQTSGGSVAKASQKPIEQPRLDSYGDPLPKGAVARLGTTRWQYDGMLRFNAFLPDGKSVIGDGQSRAIRIWDFASGKEIRRIVPPGGMGFFMAFAGALTRDGKTFAFALPGDSEISLHDLATGRQLPGIKIEKMGFVGALAFSPDGQRLASLHLTGVRVWDWAEAKEILSFNPGRAESGSPLGSMMYSPDGKSIATITKAGDPKSKLNSKTGVVKLWDAATGGELRSFGEYADIGGFAFSPNGKTLAVWTNSWTEKSITLLETSTGKKVGKLIDQEWFATFKPLVTLDEREGAMIFSHDGTKLYEGGATQWGKVREWDVNTEKIIRQANAPLAIGTSCALSPDGNSLLFSHSNGPMIYDIGGKDIVFRTGPSSNLNSVEFLADGKTLLTWVRGHRLGFDPKMLLWDIASGKNVGHVTFPKNAGPLVFAALPGGEARMIGVDLSGNPAPRTAFVLNSAIGTEPTPIKLPRPSNGKMRFSSDGKLLALRDRGEKTPAEKQGGMGSGVRDKTDVTVELYELPSGKLRHTLAIGKANPAGYIGRFRNSPLLFSNDGKVLASATDPVPDIDSIDEPSSIGFWDVATGRRLGSIPCPKDPAYRSGEKGMSFSPDGRCFAVEMTDGRTAFYELATLQMRCMIGKMQAKDLDIFRNSASASIFNPAGVTCFNFSHDGRSLVQTDRDGFLHIWDIITGSEFATFKGHTAIVNAAAFSPDGKTVASASDDGTALIWDVSKIARPALPPKVVQGGDLEKHWQTLDKSDAAQCFAAMCDLVAAPKDAVPFLKGRLKPSALVDMKRVEEMLLQLDSDLYPVRKTAEDELKNLDEQILPALNKALAANPPLDSKLRMEGLRAELTGMVLKGERLRTYRAIEVLELIGTPEAKQVLRTLGEGVPGALVTTSAQAALRRAER